MQPIFEFKTLPDNYDGLAPDTSEIRLLPEFETGGLAHCTLGVGKTSLAVKHKTVSEIWYCLAGKGEIWQSNANGAEIKPFAAADSFTIPLGNNFQFRNIGNEPLIILIVTMPKWPGPDEAVVVKGNWDETK
jgi:mannose-6-phosphate isomerase-like protein (cupin superfamily)